ncbi:glucohydrolase [Anaeromassilibacillus sp. An172]|uniref:glycoside hydrolase family 13 protein n=1 Tax=Anaeromassilibacillus sp. An172 TaxID=1965570 RepID=UPI000B3A343D|nr:alpha-glucosidase [Anaeromassilibacillus sp. An172]OUP79333.1 glucohydrolase [Anaeromassilibacillus sp. An172]
MLKDWWKNSVVYQIYPRSFCDGNGDGVGDIKGIISKLWYLSKLGIDVIWLSPTYPSPNADNGYDISDYYGVSEEYGTMDEMKELIKKCDELGIKIVMDLVVNHSSDEHPWFIEAKKSKDNKYRDFYIWRKGDGENPPNDLKASFGGSAWEYSPETGEYYLHFFSKKQPDLNWENPNMRKEIWKMMNYWIDLGIGGFRMDVIDTIGKVPDKKIRENGPMLHEYIKEMHRETLDGKNLLTVGECWSANTDDGIKYSNPERHELSMIFQFEQCMLDRIPGGERWDSRPLQLTELKQVFSKWQNELYGKGWNSLFWDNHDLPRIVSRWGNDGEYRVLSAKMLATLLHGMQGTPYIYQGEEIGMTNVPFNRLEDFSDIESVNMRKEWKEKGKTDEEILVSLKRNSRDNARTPMQWNSGYQAGFTTGTPWYKLNPNYVEINAEDALNDENSIFYYYQKLIKLRKSTPAIIHGKYELLLPEDEDIYAYLRTYEGETILVVCNFHNCNRTFSFEGKGETLISNYPTEKILDLKNIELKPYESAIYKII